MESFFGAPKTEMIHRTRFRTRQEARAAFGHALGSMAVTPSLEYIEIFYNRQRRHSSIEYRTPAQARMDMTTKLAA